MRFGLPQYDPENYNPEPAPEPTFPQPEPTWAEQRQAAFAMPEPEPTPPWESTWAAEREAAFAPAPDLAPDFLRQIPTSAIEEDHRQVEAEDFLTTARKGIADRWLEISQADIRAQVGEIAGEAAAGAGGMLDQWRDDLLGQIPQEVTSGQRLLNPLEVMSMAGISPLGELTDVPGRLLAKGAALGGESDPVLETGFNLVLPGIATKTRLAGKGLKWADAMLTDDVLRAANQLPAPGPGWRSLVQEKLGMVEEQIADAAAPINRLGMTSEALHSAYAGRVGGSLQRVEDDLGPVHEVIQEDLPQLNKFRMLNTYLEAAAAKMNPERLFPGGGIKNVADARAKLDDMLTTLPAETKARITQADEMVNQVLRDLLEEEVNAGLVPRELAAKLNEMFPHYNPIVHLEYLKKAVDGKGGSTLQQMTNTLKRLTEEGSEDNILPPMQALLKTIMERDVAIRRNTLLNSIVDEGKFPATPSITRTTGPEIKRGAEPGFPTALEDWTRRRDEARDLAGGRAPQEWYDENPRPPSPVATVAQARGRPGPNKLNFMKDGKPWDADVPDDVFRAITSMGADQLGAVENIAMGLNRSLRLGATTLNPAFLITNMSRDYIQAYMREGILPQEIAGMLADALAHGPVTRQFRRGGGSHGAMGGFYAGPEKQKAFAAIEQDVRRAGGRVVDQGDLTRFTRALENRDVKEVAKFLGSLGPLREVGEAIEMAPRLATFARHLEKGESVPEAVMAGRRVTVDFDRAGALVRQLNAFVPFLNARVQGGLNMGRTLRDKPEARLKASVMSAGIAGVLLWNKQFPQYKDVPNYLKDGFLPIILPTEPTPKENGLGYEKMDFVTIPLGDWASFAVGIEEGLDALNGDSKGAVEALSRVVNATNPVPGQGGFGNVPVGSGVMDTLIGMAPLPAPFKVAQEQAANYDYFRGRAIESETMEGMLPENRYTTRTSELAKRVSEALPDGVKISPVRIDHIIQGMTAGAGRLATQAISTGLLGQETENAPVAGGLLAGVYRTYGGEIENRAYSDRDEAMGSLASEYRPYIRTMEEVTGTGSLGRVPATIHIPAGQAGQPGEDIPLLPAEQVQYQHARLAHIANVFKEENLDAVLARQTDPEIRKAIVQDVVSESNKLAVVIVSQLMGGAELDRRAERERQSPRSRNRALPRPEYRPVGVR